MLSIKTKPPHFFPQAASEIGLGGIGLGSRFTTYNPKYLTTMTFGGHCAAVAGVLRYPHPISFTCCFSSLAPFQGMAVAVAPTQDQHYSYFSS